MFPISQWLLASGNKKDGERQMTAPSLVKGRRPLDGPTSPQQPTSMPLLCTGYSYNQKEIF